MAWQEVETDVGAKLGRCSWSVHMKHGGARVTIPESVATELNWSAATILKLQIGAGEMDGSLRLVADRQGKIACKAPPKGKGLIIRLGRWPNMAPRDVDKISVEHEVQIEHGALVVRLPRHAQNAAPAPRPQQATTPPPPGPTAAKRDVSHQFFNDPKPRSVALASGTRSGK